MVVEKKKGEQGEKSTSLKSRAQTAEVLPSLGKDWEDGMFDDKHSQYDRLTAVLSESERVRSTLSWRSVELSTAGERNKPKADKT